VRSALAGVLQALYACLAQRCPVLGEAALGALHDPTYRLYNCQRCSAQVRICQRCDHGQIYCAGDCARIRRRECLRRAGARYQRTRRGALCHAARQRMWRARQRQEVTHQGYTGGELCRSVSDHPITMMEPSDAYRTASIQATSLHGSEALARCAFCRAPLSQWTRLRRWPWSG